MEVEKELRNLLSFTVRSTFITNQGTHYEYLDRVFKRNFEIMNHGGLLLVILFTDVREVLVKQSRILNGSEAATGGGL